MIPSLFAFSPMLAKWLTGICLIFGFAPPSGPTNDPGVNAEGIIWQDFDKPAYRPSPLAPSHESR